MQAETALTNAEAGLSSATTDAAMLAAYRAIQGAADNLVTALSTHGGAAADIAAAARKSESAKNMVNDLMEKVAEANKAMVAMAMKLHAGLSDNVNDAGTEDDANTALANSGAGFSTFTSSGDVTMTTDGGSTTVDVTKTDTAVPSLADWAGSDYVKSESGTTDHVVLYSNQRTETKSVKFSEKFGVDGLNILTPTAMNSMKFEIIEASLNANSQLVKGDDFATSGTKMHSENDEDEESVMGTFDGVSGKYSCTQSGTTTCDSQVNATGNITLAGGWSFVADSLDSMTMTKTMDAAYLIYGWWSRESSAGVDVATFASTVPSSGTTVESGNTAANGINGTATYIGGAAGKYAVYNPLGDNSSAGAFTANATLTANFTNNKISGELTDFMANGESMDWAVSLDDGDAANIDASGIGNTSGSTADNVTTTWTMGGVADDPRGSWSGNFYKSNGATSTTEPDTQAPTAVTGEFTAMYDVGGLNIGQMAGAFGAELEE